MCFLYVIKRTQNNFIDWIKEISSDLIWTKNYVQLKMIYYKYTIVNYPPPTKKKKKKLLKRPNKNEIKDVWKANEQQV